MTSPIAQSGILHCGIPFARISRDGAQHAGEGDGDGDGGDAGKGAGPGGRLLVVFDDFRVEHRAAEGLVLQGMMGAYERYVEAGYTVYIVERSSQMPIDYTFDDIRDDYASAVAEIAAREQPPAVDLLGVGAGGLFALAVAANAESEKVRTLTPAHSRGITVSRLVLLSSAARMSEVARSASARWRDAAEHLRWRALHRDMVRWSHVGASAVFYSTLAWLFPNLLGTTDYPWDFSITLREVAAVDVSDRLASIEAPTLLLGGDQDHIFSPGDMEETARAMPRAELRMFPAAGHAVGKFRAREIENRVISFLQDDETR